MVKLEKRKKGRHIISSFSVDKATYDKIMKAYENGYTIQDIVQGISFLGYHLSSNPKYHYIEKEALWSFLKCKTCGEVLGAQGDLDKNRATFEAFKAHGCLNSLMARGVENSKNPFIKAHCTPNGNLPNWEIYSKKSLMAVAVRQARIEGELHG